jgi:hypothetical protein
MSAEAFVWGCFPFSATGFDLQAVSSGVSRQEVEDALRLIASPERQRIAALARDLPESSIVGVFTMSLPAGETIVGWVFVTGRDAYGRKGIYAIHGYLLRGTPPVAPPLLLLRMIDEGRLRSTWKPADLDRVSAGQGLDGKPRAAPDGEEANRRKAAAWSALLPDEAPAGEGRSGASQGWLVLDGNLLALQRGTGAKSRRSRRRPVRRKSRFPAVLAVACAVVCMGGCALYMSTRKDTEPSPQPPAAPQPKPEASSLSWAKEPHKVVAWCAEFWNCGTHAEEKLPAIRLQRVLKEVLAVLPDEADQVAIDAWVDSLPLGRAADAAGVATLVKRLREGFRLAAAVALPEDLGSQAETDAYFNAVAEALLGRELPDTRAHDILFTVQKELADSAKYVTVTDLQRGAMKDTSLKPSEKQRLLAAVRACRAAIELVSGDGER